MSSTGSWMDATISAGGNKTSAIDLGDKYDYLDLIIPTIEECKLSLEVAENATSDYSALGRPDVTTDSETFGRADTWTLGGYQHIKIVATPGLAEAVTIRIRGWR